jgi:hypothetical protein
MRFIWFNLMPWPYLPEDFREKYRSVWVDIPSSLYDPVRGHEVYNDYLDQLEFAETVGFDGLGGQRAPRQRLRPDALAHPDGSGAGAAHLARGAPRARRSSCSAARSRCTNLQSGSPRNSRCLT